MLEEDRTRYLFLLVSEKMESFERFRLISFFLSLFFWAEIVTRIIDQNNHFPIPTFSLEYCTFWPNTYAFEFIFWYYSDMRMSKIASEGSIFCNIWKRRNKLFNTRIWVLKKKKRSHTHKIVWGFEAYRGVLYFALRFGRKIPQEWTKN